MATQHPFRCTRLYPALALLTTAALLTACEPNEGGNNQTDDDLTLSFAQTKVFRFDWKAVAGADSYQLQESLSGKPATELPILEDIAANATHAELEVPLFASTQAHYFIQSCDHDQGFCEDVAEVRVTAEDLAKLNASIGYIKAPDPLEILESDYNFGGDLALSGDGHTLAVGALEGEDNDTNETKPGVVYIYTHSGVGQWQFDQAIYANSPRGFSDFGSALSLNHDGTRLVIGASSDTNDNDFQTGTAYIYELDDSSNEWAFITRLSPADDQEFSYFGHSVSVSSDGSVVVIGTPEAYGENHSDTNIEEGFGAVYSFREADNWTTPEILRSNSPGTTSHFGAAVSLNEDGTVLAVGEPRATITKDGTDFIEAGAAYVFTRTTSNDSWTPPGKAIVALLPREENDFGRYLSLSANGTTLAVGVPYDGSAGNRVYNLPDSNLPANDDGAANTSGAVYVFQSELDEWEPKAYIKASNAAEDDNFGAAVSLNKEGTLLAVGAPYQNDLTTGINAQQILDRGDENYAGAAYTFILSDRIWSQQSYLKASNANKEDNFGNAVALSADGRTLAIAAPSEDNGAQGVNGAQSGDKIINSGAVYLY